MVEDKRDFREETLLNASEFTLLREIAGDLGLSKSAAIRYCIHVVGSDLIRRKHQFDTRMLPEVLRNAQ